MVTDIEPKPIEDKKIKIGVTLMTEDPQQLLEDVAKWELTKEVIQITYSVTPLMVGAQQIGANVNLNIKPMHCAFIIYWGTVSELKVIKFEQGLKIK